MAQPAVRITGLREVLRVTDELPRETAKAVRREIREAATVVKDEADRIFRSNVSGDRKKSRYGVSVRRAGTVRVEQRVRSKKAQNNPRLRRPKFVDLQLDDVLVPAAEHKSSEIDQHMTNVLERLQRKWVTG